MEKEWQIQPKESDEALVERYRAGDARAADELIERYKQLVRARARTLFLTGGDRDDLLQEGMLGIFKAIRNYDTKRDNGASFQTYASLCIDRQMYSAILASQRKKNQPLNHSVPLDTLEAERLESYFGMAESPEARILDEVSVRQFVDEIRQLLSAYESQVLELYLDGLNYLEIAETLGKSPKSVDNALNRMKTKVSANYKVTNPKQSGMLSES